MSREIHVAKTGCDYADGTMEHPYLTITKAAKVAVAGDTVIVHEGEYREWVKPQNGGESDAVRITYQAAENEHVVIKGSERITCWEPVEGTVWKAVLPNSMFGDENPYAQPMSGDWLVYPLDMYLHTGDVYLNGVSFFEAKTLEDVKKAERRERPDFQPHQYVDGVILNPDQTIYQWYCETDKENTTIYANFHEADPNKELVEINVRQSCFYPDRVGVNYITVRGFEMAQAACPWAPPTADQPGLIGPHWSKGWIIENNDIHDAKCSAVSLGKEYSTGHNEFTKGRRKPGYQYQMEAVFRALQIGWSKEKIGSHIVRNNVIHDCGQNGVVGHLGGVFSEIYGNHIYNIATKHEFFGHEIAGIKMHAAIDVQIHNNRIDHCTLGTWLDWEAQGTRVSKNLYYANGRDIMIEVTHGPCLLDNNIFGSAYNFLNVAQGTALVGNLCAGGMLPHPVLDRATPYHFAHSTQVFGYAFVYGGDDRYYNNLMFGHLAPEGMQTGTDFYNGSPVSLDDYYTQVRSFDSSHDHDLFFKVKQPAYVDGNVYYGGAKPFDKEEHHAVLEGDAGFKLEEEGNEVYLVLNLDEEALKVATSIQGTATLGSTRIDEGIFDDPNGKPIVLDTDYFDNARACQPTVGPIEGLKAGLNRIKVW